LLSIRFVLFLGTALLGPILCNASAPETVLQALKRYGIEINEAALIQALSDSRKEVRGLAAAELAEMKVTDALPQIVQAAESEQDGLTRVNIASAATSLGSEQALSILKGLCAEGTMPGYVRVAAAQSVFRMGDHNCFLTLADMVEFGTDTEGRIEGLALLAQVKPKTDKEEKIALNLALGALQDPQVMVRLQACDAVRWIGDPKAIAPLQAALDHEQEEVVRNRIAVVLKFLLGSPRQPQR
jgi:HEAT repeat protein